MDLIIEAEPGRDEMSGHQDMMERLNFIGLDENARTTLRSLQPVIKREVKVALASFYAQIDKTPVLKALFRDDRHIESANQRQQSHWDLITTAEFGEPYEKAVQTIGQVHARIGLEPRWYIGGYAIVTERLLRSTLAHFWPKQMLSGGKKQREAASDAVACIVKAVMLDMDFAISIYLDALADERNRRRDAEREKAVADDRLTMAELGAGLRALSSGDMTHRILVDFPQKASQLKVDFNGTMEKLQETLTTVAETASAIGSGTEEISLASSDLSKRTEQQAANLAETAAALNAVTGRVRQTAEGSKHARAVVADAKGTAERSGQVVRQAIEAMNGIERSSSQIGRIIGVIDEISFQTNLLALNAGVEAARAGEAGRGFAVVASEVRALAQRSAEAAKEIKALISDSSRHVEQGVTLVAQTGQALERMMVQVAEIDSVVDTIAASSREQATGLDEVNVAVGQLDQITQQNAAMVEESTAAGQSLAVEAESLVRKMGDFNIGQERTQVLQDRARLKNSPVARPAPSVPMLRTSGSGGAVRRRQPAAPVEWSEF